MSDKGLVLLTCDSCQHAKIGCIDGRYASHNGDDGGSPFLRPPKKSLTFTKSTTGATNSLHQKKKLHKNQDLNQHCCTKGLIFLPKKNIVYQSFQVVLGLMMFEDLMAWLGHQTSSSRNLLLETSA